MDNSAYFVKSSPGAFSVFLILCRYVVDILKMYMKKCNYEKICLINKTAFNLCNIMHCEINFPKAWSHWLLLSYFDRWMPVICRDSSTIACFKGHLLLNYRLVFYQALQE